MIFSIRLPEKFIEYLDGLARKRGVSRSSVMREIIESTLEALEKTGLAGSDRGRTISIKIDGHLKKRIRSLKYASMSELVRTAVMFYVLKEQSRKFVVIDGVLYKKVGIDELKK